MPCICEGHICIASRAILQNYDFRKFPSLFLELFKTGGIRTGELKESCDIRHGLDLANENCTAFYDDRVQVLGNQCLDSQRPRSDFGWNVLADIWSVKGVVTLSLCN
jgi:hypothetical protein